MELSPVELLEEDPVSAFLISMPSQDPEILLKPFRIDRDTVYVRWHTLFPYFCVPGRHD